jgi:hypothetical protein
LKIDRTTRKRAVFMRKVPLSPIRFWKHHRISDNQDSSSFTRILKRVSQSFWPLLQLVTNRSRSTDHPSIFSLSKTSL